jgi:hypothetical protein
MTPRETALLPVKSFLIFTLNGDGPAGTLLYADATPFAVIVIDFVSLLIRTGGDRQFGAEKEAVVAEVAHPAVKAPLRFLKSGSSGKP